MSFAIKTCIVCEEEFELRPEHAGYANRCPQCNQNPPDSAGSATKQRMDADERKALAEANEGRRKAMRDLLYRKDS